MKTYYLLVFYLISYTTYAQESRDSIVFSITFSSCFNKDLIGLSINGNPIFKTLVTTTDRVIDISNVSLYQDEKAMWIAINKETKKYKKIMVKRQLTLEISINNKPQIFTIDLTQGNNIFIDNCHLPGTMVRLHISQFRGVVELD